MIKNTTLNIQSIPIHSLQKTSKPPVAMNHAWHQATLFRELPTQGIRIVQSVSFSPDGKLIAATDIAGKVILRDAITLQNIKEIDTGDSQVNAILFTSDGKQLVTAGFGQTLYRDWNGLLEVKNLGNHIKLFDVGTGRLVRTISESLEKSFFENLSISSDDCIVLATSSNGKTQKSVKAWNICTKKEGYSTSGTSLGAVSPDGNKMIFANSKESIINVVDPRSGRFIRSFLVGDKPISAIAVDKDSKILAVGNDYGEVIILDLNTGKSFFKLRRSVKNQSDFNCIESVTFSADGTTIASADCRGNIVFWNWKLGKYITTLNHKKGTIFSINFSPDGQTLISGGSGYAAKVWR